MKSDELQALQPSFEIGFTARGLALGAMKAFENLRFRAILTDVFPGALGRRAARDHKRHNRLAFERMIRQEDDWLYEQGIDEGDLVVLTENHLYKKMEER